ncbi:MAG TPA: hypothetical protein VFM09_04610 [Marmoricola sp.]|nr:hypothetical protein [Marmoricola sp.]
MTTRSLRPALVAVGLAGMLVLAGCGGGLDAQETKAAHNLSRALQQQHLTAKDASCVSRGWVGNVGTDKLVSSGVLKKDLTPDPHNTTKPPKDVVVGFVDAYFQCVNYGKLEAQKFDEARPNLINKAHFAACANEIDKGDAKQAMIDDLLGRSTRISTSVQHQLLSCIS